MRNRITKRIFGRTLEMPGTGKSIRRLAKLMRRMGYKV